MPHNFSDASSAGVIRPSRALSIREAASRAGIGRTSIFKYVRQQKLVAHKAGSRTLIYSDDLDSFLADLPRVGAAAKGGE